MITESQNGWGWQRPLSLSGPTPAWAGHPEQDAQAPPRQLCKAPQHLWAVCARAPYLQSTDMLSWCSGGTSCVPLWAQCLLPGTGHHWQEPGSVLFALSLHICMNVDKISPLMTAQKRPSEQNYLNVRLETATRVGGSLNEFVRVNHLELI